METLTNDDYAGILKLTGQLLELHGENSFKVNAYTNAAFKIDKYPEPVSDLIRRNLTGQMEGIGSGIKAALKEIYDTGKYSQLETLLEQTPEGILELLRIKGIGPKKVAVIWKLLDITTPGELLYACIENRLVEVKGFGAKTQESIRKSIEFNLSNRGKLRLSQARNLLDPILDLLKNQGYHKVEYTGEIRRACNIIHTGEILIAGESAEAALHAFRVSGFLKDLESIHPNQFSGKTETGFTLSIHCCREEIFEDQWLKTTATAAHLTEAGISATLTYSSEQEAYTQAGLPFFPPELREGKGEVARYKVHGIPELLQFKDFKGILHAHSTWSDGEHTLEQMAKAAKDAGYQYLGISDHSKAAFYANGLSEGRIEAQHQEIDMLNQKLAPFKILKGIEADILNDGSLDYSPEVLKTFDFVIASIHSNLKMSEEKAMHRLLTAIENPYTTILGHPTGRLILAREGYPIDHKKIIDACAKHNVIIELNANPYRLDLDWEWIPYALEKGVTISVNPDAHSKQGYGDLVWGMYSARKGGLSAAHTFNCYELETVEKWMQAKKNS